MWQVSKGKKCTDLNENENKKCKKQVQLIKYWGKFIALSAYIIKEESSIQ